MPKNSKSKFKKYYRPSEPRPNVENAEVFRNRCAEIDDTDPHESIKCIKEMFKNRIDEDVITMVFSECECDVNQALETLISLSEDVIEDTSFCPKESSLNVGLQFPVKDAQCKLNNTEKLPSFNDAEHLMYTPDKNYWKSEDKTSTGYSDVAKLLNQGQNATCSYNNSFKSGLLSAVQPQFITPLFSLSKKNGACTSPANSEKSFHSSASIIDGSTEYANLVKNIRSGNRILIILRGLPGSGKSTVALKLKFTGVVFSTDDYFVKRGNYVFDPDRLGEAHLCNKIRTKKALRKAITPIIIDNTNVMTWEMIPYVKMGLKFNYQVHIVEPNTPWKFDPRELSFRNKHKVNKEKIDKMLERFEHNVSIETIIHSLELKSEQSDDEVVSYSPVEQCDVQNEPAPHVVNLDDGSSEAEEQNLKCISLQAVIHQEDQAEHSLSPAAAPFISKTINNDIRDSESSNKSTKINDLDELRALIQEDSEESQSLQASVNSSSLDVSGWEAITEHDEDFSWSTSESRKHNTPAHEKVNSATDNSYSENSLLKEHKFESEMTRNNLFSEEVNLMIKNLSDDISEGKKKNVNEESDSLEKSKNEYENVDMPHKNNDLISFSQNDISNDLGKCSYKDSIDSSISSLHIDEKGTFYLDNFTSKNTHHKVNNEASLNISQNDVNVPECLKYEQKRVSTCSKNNSSELELQKNVPQVNKLNKAKQNTSEIDNVLKIEEGNLCSSEPKVEEDIFRHPRSDKSDVNAAEKTKSPEGEMTDKPKSQRRKPVIKFLFSSLIDKPDETTPSETSDPFERTCQWGEENFNSNNGREIDEAPKPQRKRFSRQMLNEKITTCNEKPESDVLFEIPTIKSDWHFHEFMCNKSEGNNLLCESYLDSNKTTGTQTQFDDFILYCGNEGTHISNTLPSNNIVESISLERFYIFNISDKGTSTDDLDPKYDHIAELTNYLHKRFPEITEHNLNHLIEICHGNTEWLLDILTEWQEDNKSLNSLKAEIFRPNPKFKSNVDTLKNFEPSDSVLEFQELDTSIDWRTRYSAYVKNKFNINLNSGAKNNTEIPESVNSSSSPNLQKNRHPTNLKKNKSRKKRQVKTLKLVLDPSFAMDLERLFGSVTGVEGNTSEINRTIEINLDLARFIHKKWKETTNKVMPLDLDFEPETSEYEVYEPEPLTEIMDKETAMQLWLKERADMNGHYKETRHTLYERYPGADVVILDEILAAHNGSLESAICAIEENIECINAPKQAMTYGNVAQMPKVKQKQPASRENMYQDFENNDWSDWVHKDKTALTNEPLNTSDLEAKAAELRQDAAFYYQLRQTCVNKAQEYYCKGIQGAATYYAQESHKHAERAKKANKEASALITQYKNITHDATVLDLHGLYIQEAVPTLEKFLRDKKLELRKHTKPHPITVSVITGKGNHSERGAKLRPSVIEYLRKTGYRYSEVNPGMLQVQLLPEN